MNNFWKIFIAIVGGLGVLGTGFGYLSGGFNTLKEEADRQAKIDLMILQYDLAIDSNHTFLSGLTRLRAVENTLVQREKDIKEYYFTMRQIQNILFGELHLVLERDAQGNHYHFWANNAGDYWLVINKIPYIVQYQRSEDYWYYRTYDNKYIHVPPAESPNAPAFQTEIDEDEEELSSDQIE